MRIWSRKFNKVKDGNANFVWAESEQGEQLCEVWCAYSKLSCVDIHTKNYLHVSEVTQ